MTVSPYLNRPCRSLAEVLGLRLARLRGDARLADVAEALLRQAAEDVT